MLPSLPSLSLLSLLPLLSLLSLSLFGCSVVVLVRDLACDNAG